MLQVEGKQAAAKADGLHLAFGSIVWGLRWMISATDNDSASEQSPVERFRHCTAACSIDRFYPRTHDATIKISLSRRQKKWEAKKIRMTGKRKAFIKC